MCPREQQLVVCVWVSLSLLSPKNLCAAGLDNNKFWEGIRTGARRENSLGVFLERLKHLVQPDWKGALLKPLAAIRVIGGNEVRKKRVGVQMDITDTEKCCRGRVSCPQVDRALSG